MTKFIIYPRPNELKGGKGAITNIDFPHERVACRPNQWTDLCKICGATHTRFVMA